MDNLTATLTKYSKRRYLPLIRFWVGERPDVRDGKMIKEMASIVGYPTAADGLYALEHLIPISKAQAADIMAKCLTGLAYPRRVRASVVRDMKVALQDLRENALLFTNIEVFGSGYSLLPLSTATFDAGVIGFDDRVAFIFWAEDED